MKVLKYDVFLFIFIIIGVVYSDPVITKVTPSLLVIDLMNEVTIVGTSFLTSPKVYCNNVLLGSSNTSPNLVVAKLDNVKSLPIPTGGIYNFQVIDATLTASALYPVSSIKLPTFSQVNTVAFLKTSSSTFSQTMADSIKIGYQTPQSQLLFNNASVVSYQVTYEMAKNGWYGFYDKDGQIIFGTTVTYNPVITNYEFEGTNLVVTGFAYANPMLVFINGYTCSIVSLTDTKITCTPASDFFVYSSTNTLNLPLQLLYNNGAKQTTILNGALVTIQSYTASGTLSLVNGDNNPAGLNSKLVGMNAGGISLQQYSDIMASFQIPDDAQCGDSYLTNADGAKVSNTILICPTPKVSSFFGFAKTSPKISFTGKFLSATKYGSMSSAIEIYYSFSNGSRLDCPSPAISVDNSFTYSFSCPNPVQVYDGVTVKVVAQNIANFKSEYSFPYPMFVFIDSITSAKYGTPTQVTIVGKNFNRSLNEVKIGNSVCTSAISSMDGRFITCLFNSDVELPDPSNNLLDVVVTTAEDSETASIFSYTCTAQCQHGSCQYKTNSCGCDAGWSGDSCEKVEPSITAITSTDFGVPNKVTITGTNFLNLNLQVTIGTSVCSNITVTQDLKTITCLFKSDIYSGGALTVTVTIDSTFTTSNAIFHYSNICPGGSNGEMCSGHGDCNTQTFTCKCDNGWSNQICSTIVPKISSISPIRYGTPDLVTIVGENFVNLNLQVKIGGSICSNVVISNDLTTITCLFQSNIPVNNDDETLDVNVNIDNQFMTTNKIFSYLKQCLNNGIVCSSHGICNQQTFTCDCYKGWSTSNCSMIYPTITSSTSIKQNSPGQITIVGTNFVNLNLQVMIGGSICGNVVVSSDLTTITCLFKSDVALIDNNIKNALEVFVSINSTFTTKNNVFIYTKPDQKCPTGSNGKVCSDQGTCNQQYTCDCFKGWESGDCSLQNTGVIVETPVVNENNTTSTIVTPSGIYYDVGVDMINELNSNGDIILSYSLKNTKWIYQSGQQKENFYSTELPNKSNLNVKLTINDKDERVYYNFAGDIIPILPKSIKYQIELYNWTFSSTQNNVEFIFKSGITESNNECEKETTTTTQSTDDSIRSIQITMNGETLVGLFSDRMILDGRPTYNKVNRLTTDQISKYQLDTTPVYTSISTSYFKNSVVVDPNFGVLVSSTPDECSNSKGGIASWKLAVIIVCTVVGASFIATLTWMLLKKNRAKILIMKNKMKSIRMSKK
ncbi:hypothetical protein CYY_008376 [Polysphondylium violaceum]|uniref:EGF-like domain-containing protein n=1 Tax=Polysphondylium violaceum TaxID=133409 RepID=A0A8J4PN24_9MYCE|nr:hypothetical protein CYY_008376 [Polysphondylium violaceum]